MTDLTMSQFASKDDLLAAQAARIAELESQLDAIGAGGVEPLRKPAAQAVQTAVPVAWRLTNTAFRKPRFEYHDTKESAEQRQADFNRSVDDGGLHNLTPLYAVPAHPAEGVPADFEAWWEKAGDGRSKMLAKRAWHASIAAAQPAAQGMDSRTSIGTLWIDEDGVNDVELCPCAAPKLEHGEYALFAQAKQGGA